MIEQGLSELKQELENIVPDITNQYSNTNLNSEYLITNVRAMHAFQISLVNKIIKEFNNPTVIDIGDSSGTHLQYLRSMYNIKCLSVNIDPVAIQKIKEKGLEAINTNVEYLDKYNINPDIILCFETLEHLHDPISFLYNLSSKTNAKYLIITVPYLKNSRVGLHYIRNGISGRDNPENTHIFELSPEDWKLIMKYSGWDIAYEQIYLQYPIISYLHVVKWYWKKYDFEGFYGIILRKKEGE